MCPITLHRYQPIGVPGATRTERSEWCQRAMNRLRRAGVRKIYQEPYPFEKHSFLARVNSTVDPLSWAGKDHCGA